MKISKIVILIVVLCFLSLDLFAQVHQDWLTRTDSVSAQDMAVDKIGNVYIAGSIYRSAIGFNTSLVKYDAAGNQQWMKEYNGIGNGADWASAIALDTSGNIFITGYSFRGPATINDEIITIKYTPDGDTLWVRHYNSPGNKIDRAFALEVDSAGNAYVGGYLNNISFGNVYGNDYITIKYDADGMLLWAKQMYVGDGSVTDLVVDPAGNVYVTGIGFNSTVTGHDYITVKYNSTGDSLWGKHYGGLGSDPSNKATGITLDEIGNVYVTGFSTGSNGWYDYATIKYNGDGEEQWVRRFDGPINEDDKAIGIVVDKDQNVYVTGEVSVVSGSSYIKDFATIKYNTDGDPLWVKYYNGSGNSVDSPVDIAIDTSNNIYITGTSIGPWQNGSSEDYATIKYNSNGDPLWEQRYNAADLMDRPYSIVVDNSGNVYVTGISEASYTSNGSVTIKYSQPPTDIDKSNYNLPEKFSLNQNYPNPFNPSTSIQYQISSISQVTLKVYDVLGNEIATLVNEEKQAGSYEVEFNTASSIKNPASGIYFYRLQAGNFVETRKMILLK